jgi:hypothetical protein
MKGRPGEVDDHVVDARRDRRHHALLELGRGEQIHLAADRDDMDVTAHRAVLDLELDRHDPQPVPAPAGS